MGEIDKGSIYLALGRKSIAKEDKIPPLGGRPVTPEEEAKMGELLRRELEQYRIAVKDGSLRRGINILSTPIKPGTRPTEVRPH